MRATKLLFEALLSRPDSCSVSGRFQGVPEASPSFQSLANFGEPTTLCLREPPGHSPECRRRCMWVAISSDALQCGFWPRNSKRKSDLNFAVDFGVGFFLLLGDRKSLPIATNPPKSSQEFSRPFLHKFQGLRKNSPQKVHANFGRQILGNTFSGPNSCFCKEGKRPKRNPPKHPLQNSPEICLQNFPGSKFLQKPCQKSFRNPCP